jgi:hypothetical protein
VDEEEFKHPTAADFLSNNLWTKHNLFLIEDLCLLHRVNKSNIHRRNSHFSDVDENCSSANHPHWVWFLARKIAIMNNPCCHCSFSLLLVCWGSRSRRTHTSTVLPALQLYCTRTCE